MSISSRDKYATITRALYLRTSSGNGTWESTSFQDTYSTRLGAYTIHIQELVVPRVDHTDIVIRIYNEDGIEVDAYKDEDILDYKTHVNDKSNFYELMKSMYDMARREVMGSDRALDTILSSLGISEDEISALKNK